MTINRCASISTVAMYLQAWRRKLPAPRIKILIAASALAFGCGEMPPEDPLSAEAQAVGNPATIELMALAESPPLRDLKPNPPGHDKGDNHDSHGRRAMALKLPQAGTQLMATGASGTAVVDPVVQSTPGPASTILPPPPAVIPSFAGLAFNSFPQNLVPPDANIAVGANNQLLQAVNRSIVVLNKNNGTVLLGPVAFNNVWQNLGGPCAARNDGDPIVQYDKLAQRWILTQVALSSPALQCVAVSTTGDALGTFRLFAFVYPVGQLPDYTKLGVWPTVTVSSSAYLLTANIFSGGSFQGTKLCALDRERMLSGGTIRQSKCFQANPGEGGYLPGDLDGSQPPPTGAPAPFIGLSDTRLNLRRLQVNFAVAGTPTPTLSTVPAAPFTPACNADGPCIEQPQTTQRLDGLGDRLMSRFAYRAATGALNVQPEAAVVNHSVTSRVVGTTQVVGVRWYELRNVTSGTFSIFQQSTFSPTNDSRWMGSLAMDQRHNIAVGYSLSSSTTFPSILVTGRMPTDPLNTLQAERLLQAGGGSQLDVGGRWGDYTSMVIDPANDCRFYYTNQYQPATGAFNWRTRIGFFNFTGCNVP